MLWAQIYDLVIKTIVAGEPAVTTGVRRHGLARTNCFELLGFDVLIDEHFKAWLLEVNQSPSLSADSSLDHFVKSHLLKDLLGLIGLRAYDATSRKRASSVTAHISRSQSPDKGGVAHIQQFKEGLRDTLEEQSRLRHFVRVYPSPGSNYYDQFFELPRPSNTYVTTPYT